MAPRGMPVFAASSGVVPSTWTVFQEVAPNVRRAVQLPGVGTPSNPINGDGGNYVVLIDSVGRHHYYAHLSHSPCVAIGELVQAGQFVGYVGNTGRRAQYTQPHLHYQVTTRPRAGSHSTLTFWNPFGELMRLAVTLGGGRRGGRVEVSFAAFVNAVGTRSGQGLINPWDGTVTPEIINPWDMAF